MAKIGLFLCAANAQLATNVHQHLLCRSRVVQGNIKIKWVKLLVLLAQRGQHVLIVMQHLTLAQPDMHLQQIKLHVFLSQHLAATLRQLHTSLPGLIKELVFYVLKDLSA